MELLTRTDDEVRTLSRAERCDHSACGARALTLVNKDDYELIFCMHHGRMLEPTLVGQGWQVHFQPELLEEG